MRILHNNALINIHTIEAARIIFEARQALAGLFKAPDPLRVTFSANITEALNLVLNGYLRPGDHVVTSSMEHNSVIRPVNHKVREGAEAIHLVFDAHGIRVLVDPVSFNGLVESAFNQIRQNARGNPAVSMRILEALRRMAASVEDPQRKAAVLDQAKLVFESAKAADLQDLDRTGLEERYRALLESASDSAE